MTGFGTRGGDASRIDVNAVAASTVVIKAGGIFGTYVTVAAINAGVGPASGIQAEFVGVPRARR